VLLVVLVMATAAFTALGIIGNTAETSAIKGVPGVLTTYADFLQQDVNGALTCLSLKTDNINTTVTAVGGCGSTGNTAKDVIAAAALAISDTVGRIGPNPDGVVGTVDSSADGIANMADQIKEGNNSYAERSEQVVLLIVILLAVCIFLNAALGAVMGFNREADHLHCSLCVLSECMVNIMFPLMIVACIVLFVLRFAAGFCSDPFALIAKASGSTSRTSYYVRCSGLSSTQRAAEWPWATEQASVVASYNIMVQAVPNLVLDCTDTAGVAEVTASVTLLQPECVGDNSVLGVNGVMACGTIDRLLQASMTQICTDVYNPLDLICISLIGFATVVVCLNCVNHRLRRENETSFVFRKPSNSNTFGPPRSSGTGRSTTSVHSMQPSTKSESQRGHAVIENPVFVQPVRDSGQIPAVRQSSGSSQSATPEPLMISRQEAQSILQRNGSRDGDCKCVS
jgi:hypothetical protein